MEDKTEILDSELTGFVNLYNCTPKLSFIDYLKNVKLFQRTMDYERCTAKVIVMPGDKIEHHEKEGNDPYVVAPKFTVESIEKTDDGDPDSKKITFLKGKSIRDDLFATLNAPMSTFPNFFDELDELRSITTLQPETSYDFSDTGDAYNDIFMKCRRPKIYPTKEAAKQHQMQSYSAPKIN